MNWTNSMIQAMKNYGENKAEIVRIEQKIIKIHSNLIQAMKNTVCPKAKVKKDIFNNFLCI